MADIVEKETPFVRQMVRVPFYFPHPTEKNGPGGAEHTVLLKGSWDRWEGQIEMTRMGNHYEAVIPLKPSLYTYKFVVDGEWTLAEHQTRVEDENGHTNHCISVTHPSASSNALDALSIQIPSPLEFAAATAPASSTTPSAGAGASAGGASMGAGISISTENDETTPYATPLASPHRITTSLSSEDFRQFVDQPRGPKAAERLSPFPHPSGYQTGTDSEEEYASAVSGDARSDVDGDALASSLASVASYGPAILENQLMLNGVYRVDNSNIAKAGERKLVLAMVGLPARGKSFIAQKLATYLKWIGFGTRIFNNGAYRRDNMGAFQSHDFFRPDNPDGASARGRLAKMALGDMCEWFAADDKHHIGILDATNSTRQRRKFIINYLKKSKTDFSAKVVFIEVICNRPEVIRRNILHKHKYSPDYVGMTEAEAVADFSERIAHYEAAYEPVQERSVSFIRLFDVGRETQTNRIKGYLPTKIVFFLMNMHIVPRPIYLTRHGESEFNQQDRIGGDSPLTHEGLRYAKKLSEWMEEETERDDTGYLRDLESDLVVFTSTMIRTIQTAEELKCAQLLRWKALEEIDAGICDGLTPDEFKATFPDEYAARIADKLNFTYSQGESYRDLIARLEPVIIELERQVLPVIVVGHQAILRCIYGYFAGLDIEEVPHTPIPLHTVIRLVPRAYGLQEERHCLYRLSRDIAHSSGSIHADSPIAAAAAATEDSPLK